jgi:hypothetical protein
MYQYNLNCDTSSKTFKRASEMTMATAKNNKEMSALGIPTAMAAKTEEIRRILSEPVVDLWKLRELALTEGGLVNGKSSHTTFCEICSNC